ncbi:MAG TPA: hypothetical protein VK447_08060 [Myxococcaceae bacterium]|nr:hypothetical protein [Myxococcaceae bacterium]
MARRVTVGIVSVRTGAMIFYGDRWRKKRTRGLLAGVGYTAETLAALPPGLQRRADLVRLLLEAGELWQGVADAGFRARGCDEHGDLERACARLTLQAAQALRDELQGRPLALEPIFGSVASLEQQALPNEVTVNTAPEGYAFYSLYPELYLAAAEELRAHGGELVVIGLRSIGTSLCAVVAAGAGAEGLPVTLRPTGHPFSREVRPSAALEQALLGGGERMRYAIVDEGPGLSGSSFGAVADWLERKGVSRDRLHFFPSHRNGLGPRASEAHRQRWDEAQKHVRDFEPSFLAEDTPLEDLGAGRWRARVYGFERRWPPADLINERRKYLFRSEDRLWLAKFAGLGRLGEEKLARARMLEAAGLHPRVLGLRHGYLVMEWLEGARPLDAGDPVDRGALVDTLSRYLERLALARPRGGAGLGAPPAKLLEMARFNAGQQLGDEVAGTLDRWTERVRAFADQARPVAGDNRMHAWEWLQLSDGRLLKVDALDHHRGPDLIGEQDLAWDLAGARVELGLTDAELETVLGRVGQLAPRPSGEALRFYEECYLAFQLGAYALAAQALSGWNAEEGQRLSEARDAYALRLRERLTGETWTGAETGDARA